MAARTQTTSPRRQRLTQTLRSPRTVIRLLPFLFLALASLAHAAEWTSRPLAELATYPEFRAPAQVVAREEARIAAEVSARVLEMPARVVERVQRGGLLVALDAAAYRIELDRVRAQLGLIESRIRLARAQLAQARALAQRDFISADGLRIRETEAGVLERERDAALAARAGAELALARTRIVAPYDGVVRERLVAVGELAGAGTPLVVFAAIDDVEVHAQVPAAQIESLKAATRWMLVAGGLEYELRLERVSPLLDAAGQARAVILRASVELPPGLGGELRWRSTRPYLPASHVQTRAGELGAWVLRDARPVFEPLPQAQAGRAVAVDWPADTQVVDEGRFALGLDAPGEAAGAAGGAAEGAR